MSHPKSGDIAELHNNPLLWSMFFSDADNLNKEQDIGKDVALLYYIYGVDVKNLTIQEYNNLIGNVTKVTKYSR